MRAPLLMAAIPLVANLVVTPAYADRAHVQLTVRRSTPRMIAGIVLTSAAALSFGVAGGLLATAHGSDGDVIGHSIFGSAFVLNGIICAAVGIPLWVTGAAHVSVRTAGDAFVPRVAVGPGSAALTWQF